MRNFFRFFAICAVMMFSSMSLSARNLNGIRVESDRVNVIVYLNGTQVCSPVRSCFIANLRPDYYHVEVYETSRRDCGYESRSGRLIYSERIYYKGRGIEKIHIRNTGGHGHHDRPGYPGYGDGCNVRVMPNGVFNDFYRAVAAEPFYSGQEQLIVSALRNYLFTSRQCRRIIREISFDNDKIKAMMLMYPNIVDKQYFHSVLEDLSFSSSRREMQRFLERYDGDEDYDDYDYDDDDYDDDDD